MPPGMTTVPIGVGAKARALILSTSSEIELAVHQAWVAYSALRLGIDVDENQAGPPITIAINGQRYQAPFTLLLLPAERELILLHAWGSAPRKKNAQYFCVLQRHTSSTERVSWDFPPGAMLVQLDPATEGPQAFFGLSDVEQLRLLGLI